MKETDTYRTPGRSVDETEVEIARVREAEETNRKKAELKQKNREDRRERLYSMMHTEWGGFVIGICALSVVGCVVACFIMLVHSRLYR